jgi:hypothetical protein
MINVGEFSSNIALNAIIVLPAPVGKIIQPFLSLAIQLSSASL